MLIIKVGGGKGIYYDTVCSDLARLYHRGHSCLLVHGGSHETNILSEQLGHPPRFVTTVSGYESRYTDRKTIEIFEMAYCGKINKMIVELLQSHDVPAIGLSGLDGRLLLAARKPTLTIVENGKKKVLRDDYTGKIESVNADLIHLLDQAGYVVTVCPPAISREHQAVNVDGDRAAARIAEAVKADELVILSNVPGLLEKIDDPSTLIKDIQLSEIDQYFEFAKGRMKRKLLAAKEALLGGVTRVTLGDARVDSPITHALSGNGTVITGRDESTRD